VSKTQILIRWEYDFGGDGNVVETFISYLRKKRRCGGPSLIQRCAVRVYAALTRADVASSPVAGGRLAMTAVGLLAAGAATYLALRSFLLDRVDQQLMASRAAVGRGARQSGTTTITRRLWTRSPSPVAFVEVRDAAGRVVARPCSDFDQRIQSRAAPARWCCIHRRRPRAACRPASRRCSSTPPAVTERARYRVLVSSLPGSGGVLIVRGVAR